MPVSKLVKDVCKSSHLSPTPFFRQRGLNGTLERNDGMLGAARQVSTLPYLVRIIKVIDTGGISDQSTSSCGGSSLVVRDQVYREAATVTMVKVAWRQYKQQQW